MTESVPAGWYPTPNGDQRYWDGEKWTSLPWTNTPDDANEELSESAGPPRNKKRARLLIAGGITVIVILGLIGGGLAWKSGVDSAAALELRAQEKANAAETRREAEAARKEAADKAERSSRTTTILEIEASVKTMAEGHAADGIVDGPVISVSCSPTGGGSIDDLTALTTVFDCFVANKDNGDGTSSGYYYNSTMNWTSGTYTYGLGRS